MIRELDSELRILVPDVEGNWLYQQQSENERVFSQLVYLGKEADPSDWHECTTAEKEEWEREHTPEYDE